MTILCNDTLYNLHRFYKKLKNVSCEYDRVKIKKINEKRRPDLKQ